MYGIEKEMIEDYGVESSVWIGGKRIVLGINEENTEKPRYMSCIVTDNGLFGRYEGITTDDYFEALKHFGENIGAESIILRNEQKIDGLKDTACLTPKDMIPIDWHYSIKECTVAVKPEVLSEGAGISAISYTISSADSAQKQTAEGVPATDGISAAESMSASSAPR